MLSFEFGAKGWKADAIVDLYRWARCKLQRHLTQKYSIHQEFRLSFRGNLFRQGLECRSEISLWGLYRSCGQGLPLYCDKLLWGPHPCRHGMQ